MDIQTMAATVLQTNHPGWWQVVNTMVAKCIIDVFALK